MYCYICSPPYTIFLEPGKPGRKCHMKSILFVLLLTLSTQIHARAPVCIGKGAPLTDACYQYHQREARNPTDPGAPSRRIQAQRAEVIVRNGPLVSGRYDTGFTEACIRINATTPDCLNARRVEQAQATQSVIPHGGQEVIRNVGQHFGQMGVILGR